MARDSSSKDVEGASSTSGQSKRPPIYRHESDTLSQGDSASRQSGKQHQKQHHVGRLHARVPSSKALAKHQHHGNGSSHVQNAQQGRRALSPNPQRPSNHRRATSDVKLQRNSSSSNIPHNQSSSSLKRNRSHGDVHKRNKSSDKLKRLSAGSTAPIRPKSSKSQVHFDLGSDGQEDEGDWVDASGSNSPHMSRKGSINSSAQSSLRPALSVNNSRPETPNEPSSAPKESDTEIRTPERERTSHQQYLTTRLLQRTPSYGAQPQVSVDMAEAKTAKHSPDSVENETSTLQGSTKGSLVSRFVDAPATTVSSQGSFYQPSGNEARHSEDLPRRPKSTINLSSRSQDDPGSPRIVDEVDDSALVPRPARRTAAQPAETSRIQQKLNLQRASSAMEPGHTAQAGGGVATPLIGVGGAGCDGGASRDPRVNKLLERTGMEYLVVRRYQNPVARSLRRLGHSPDLDRQKRIPRLNTASTASKRSSELSTRHQRNISLPDARRPVTPKNPPSVRTAPGSSFDGDEESRANERLSGSSLVGSLDDDGTTAILRNLWEKPLDLSASGD